MNPFLPAGRIHKDTKNLSQEASKTQGRAESTREQLLFEFRIAHHDGCQLDIGSSGRGHDTS
jgi:hypothetical protein